MVSFNQVNPLRIRQVFHIQKLKKYPPLTYIWGAYMEFIWLGNLLRLCYNVEAKAD